MSGAAGERATSHLVVHEGTAYGKGELALVRAWTEGYEEVAPRVPAIDGKTWNHPIVVDGVVYLRNAEEMAAYRLP